MQEEKARKQRLHPLPGILEGPVAPHPDLPGLLGGQGLWASLWRPRRRLPRQRPRQPRPPAGSGCCTSGRAGGRQTLPGQQTKARPTALLVSPYQPLIKGWELSRAGDTLRKRAVASVTSTGEVGGATSTPRHTNTHWQQGDHTCAAGDQQLDTQTHKGLPHTQYTLTYPETHNYTPSRPVCTHTHTHTQATQRQTHKHTQAYTHRLIHTLTPDLGQSHPVPQTWTHITDTQAFTHFLHSDTPEDKHTDVWRHTLI